LSSPVLSPTLTPPAIALPPEEQAWMVTLCERMRNEFGRLADGFQSAMLATLARLLLGHVVGRAVRATRPGWQPVGIGSRRGQALFRSRHRSKFPGRRRHALLQVIDE